MMMAPNTTTDGSMDEMARDAAHDALGVQIYPGTEIMTDGTAPMIIDCKVQTEL